MTSKRIAVVTGGNKGVGLEICRQLADEVVVVLTARDEKRGADAVAKLHFSGLSDVIFHQLDVTDPASITSLANFVDAHFGKIDILLIEEKAKGSKKVVKQTFEGAQRCMETNYYGAKHVTQALLPLLLKSTSPRVVNISSKLGQLVAVKYRFPINGGLDGIFTTKKITMHQALSCGRQFDTGYMFMFLQNMQDVRARMILSDYDGLTEERVDLVVSEYMRDAKDEELLETKGWTSNLSGYIVSKAALNAYTRILAKRFPTICANAVSPGLVATDMTFFRGTFTAEEGAKGPVRLALIPDGGPSGQCFWMMQGSTF